MRRGIAILMILLTFLSIIPYRAEALEFTDEFYYVDDYYEAIYNMYDVSYGAYGSSWDWFFSSDESFAYVQADKVFDGYDCLASAYINIAMTAINGVDWFDAEHSLENTAVQYYEVALISLLKTVEQNLMANGLATQENADATMAPLDYIIEAANAAAGAVGIQELDGSAEILQNLIGSVTSSVSILDNARSFCKNQEDYDTLNKLSQVYSSLDLILTAIGDYPNSEQSESIGYLKIAARNVRRGLCMTLAVNLHNFNEFLEPSVNEFTSFVFTDVLEEVTEEDAREILGKVSDENMECLSLLSKSANLLSSFSAGVEIGVFIGDIFLGSSDTLLRYHEIRAMAGVRRALLYQAEKLRAKISGPEDFELISLFGQYLYSLLYTSARGEYCVYRLQKADAHLLTIMVDGASLDTWYETLIERIANMTNGVSALYPNPDYYLREESTDEYESTTVKSLTKVSIFENGSLYSEEYFTYNETGLISEIKSYYYPDDGYGNKESTTTLIYDSENRLTSKSCVFPNATTGDYTIYTYNEEGTMVSYDSNDGGHIDFEYDQNNRLVRDTQKFSDGSITISEHFYDENGSMVKSLVTDSYGTAEITYEYDSESRVSRAIYSNGYSLDEYLYSYDYELFRVSTSQGLGFTFTSIDISDVTDQPIVSYAFEDAQLIVTEDRYLARVIEENANRIYEFYYDGETPDVSAMESTQTNNIEIGGNCGDNLTWGINGATNALVISGSGSMYNYSYPNYTEWTSKKLTSIELTEGVSSIGTWAFAWTGVTKVSLPSSVTVIGENAFYGCDKLIRITLPPNVTSINSGLFWDCSSLTSIIIPNSVTAISDYAFYGCTGLTDVYYTGTEEQWQGISIGSNNECLSEANVHYDF